MTASYELLGDPLKHFQRGTNREFFLKGGLIGCLLKQYILLNGLHELSIMTLLQWSPPLSVTEPDTFAIKCFIYPVLLFIWLKGCHGLKTFYETLKWAQRDHMNYWVLPACSTSEKVLNTPARKELSKVNSSDGDRVNVNIWVCCLIINVAHITSDVTIPPYSAWLMSPQLLELL